MTRNKWIIIIVGALIALGSLIALSGRNNLDVSAIDTNKIISAGTMAGPTKVDIGDHVYGNSSGKVLLVEYGDFQCPSCGALHPNLKPLLAYYKDSLTFVFRNFPLTAIHPNALAAATAAEAVGLQGNDKYWAMHDTMYENQNSWTSADVNARTDVFKTYAKNVGADVNSFTSDLSNAKVSTKIDFDEALGHKVNIQGTPTLSCKEKA